MCAEQNTAIPQPADALMRRGRGKPDRRRDLLDLQPRIVLQEAQNADIRSVEIVVLRLFS
jgi:hypothetical protein